MSNSLRWAIASAFIKGQEARKQGKKSEDNPYLPLLQRQQREAWWDGYDDPEAK